MSSRKIDTVFLSIIVAHGCKVVVNARPSTTDEGYVAIRHWRFC
ncbi:unnamed protein product [Linum tenue]|uniref:Uncharacterized protein n=1 Tax=Linum tenue TaxID=586396 RepID=A0AAV0PRA0_9ROSI|nr:unnamed protein product [Linum tenue]